MNTLDVESDEDALSSPAACADWLRGRGLLDRPGRPSWEDLARTVAVREALRALLVANNGGTLDPDAVAVLDAAAREAGVALRFDATGVAALAPAATGVTGGLGRLLAIVAAGMAAGTWSRLKACREGTCRWAFYDRARNRSRTWCSMAVCGNRSKTRAYRARQAAH